jgi:hypothetical protein
MLEVGTFFYALMAIFVLGAVERNHREQRQSPQIVVLAGWGLCSMSATLSVLLMAAAVLSVLSGGTDYSAPLLGA